MSDIRLGIIGAGNIANEHLKIIQALDGVSAVGMTSRTRSKAEELAKMFDIDHVYETADLLLDGCSPDGIMVLVSANQIYNVAINLLPTGIPLFLEKPPGLVPEQTKSLAGVADKYRTKNMVGFNRRYYSIFHKGLEIINQNGGLLGLAVEGHERFWKNTVWNLQDEIRENWIYANSTHTIDLLRFFGGEIRNIETFTTKLKEKNGDQYVAAMDFASGAIGTYTSHWFSPGGWTVTLFGDGVTVKFKPLETGVWIDNNFKEHEIVPDDVDVEFKPGFYRQMEGFINMVKTDILESPGMDLAEVLKTMELAQTFARA